MDGLASDPGTGARSLSLIIPAYNEEAVIARAVAEADEALARLGGDYEILIVDDGSQDRTVAVAAEAARQRPRVRLLRHPENRGYGAALRTGFEAARFDRVAFTDADCQFDLADLADLLPLADRFPVVAGYRVRRQDPPLRRFFSWGYNRLVRTLLGTRVRDCDCALKVFRKTALAHLLPESTGFFVNTEILTRARQQGFRVAEVGVRHRPRQAGVSKVSVLDVPRTLRTLLPFWWSQVLFPGAASTHAGADPGLPRRQAATLLAVLLLVAGLLFFTRLRCPLLEPEEARYAEIPRQMLAEGHFVIPVLHGQPYYHKPPLLYWLVMGSYSLFGAHDWAARLVPCAAGFLTVLITCFWGWRTLGGRAGLAGAFILCLSARFLYFGRMLTLESLLCLWVVSALAAAHLAVRAGRPRWGWWLLAAVCCGLGLLTKGPVALVLVGGPVLAWQLLDRRTCRPGVGLWLAYATVALGVACPWYLLVALSDPGFPGYFFWTHNVVRYLAPYDHVQPAWFYLPGLLLGMLPWTLLLVPFVKFLGRRSAAVARRRPAALGFFLLAALLALAFFSASGCKRAGYILPVFPPLALALGGYLDAVLPWRSLGRLGNAGYAEVRRALARLPFRATLLTLVLGFAGSLLALLTGTCKPAVGLGLAAGAAAGFGACLRHGRGRTVLASWTLCAVTTFTLLLVAIHEVLPGYTRKFSLRGQVRRHWRLTRDPRLPVACYPHRWDSVSFYLRRGDVRVYTPQRRRQMIADFRRQPDTLMFVKSERFLSEFLRALPGSLEFVQRGRRGTVTAGIVRRRAADFLLARQVGDGLPRANR
jgi:dolichol-phosphate mannosyltransferase